MDWFVDMRLSVYEGIGCLSDESENIIVLVGCNDTHIITVLSKLVSHVITRTISGFLALKLWSPITGGILQHEISLTASDDIFRDTFVNQDDC